MKISLACPPLSYLFRYSHISTRRIVFRMNANQELWASDAQINLWMGRLKIFPLALILSNVVDRVKSYPVGHKITSNYKRNGVILSLEVYPGGHRELDKDKMAVGVRFFSK